MARFRVERCKAVPRHIVIGRVADVTGEGGQIGDERHNLAIHAGRKYGATGQTVMDVQVV